MAQKNITFYFEGRPLRGVEGEPVAKALFSAGVRTLSHSVKYKRPRGVFCARGRCVACHMSIDGVPGVPTCITPLEDGMRIERENYRPVYAPLATLIARIAPLPAGFYYTMFTRPAFAQKLFVRSLRRMAGVGRVTAGRTFDAPESESRLRTGELPLDDAFVVVVGSGLSGMSTAVSAAHHGAKVLVVDEYGFPGGHSFGHRTDSELVSARDDLARRMTSHTSIRYVRGVTAQAFYPPDTLLVSVSGSTGFRVRASGAGAPCDQAAGPPGDGDLDPTANARASTHAAMKRVRARSFVFATGANDVVPLFENNDTPGIFGARAIRLLLERDGLRPGTRAVVYGTGPALGETAGLLVHHNVGIVALVDPGSEHAGGVRDSRDGSRGETGAAAELSRAVRQESDARRMITGARVTRARGGAWLKGVDIARTADGKHMSLGCDLLCAAFPGQPAYELPYQAGFQYTLSESPLEESRVMRPVASSAASDDGTASFFVVGEASGETDWRKKIEDGTQSGVRAAESARI